jgi:hypothetical protein
VLRAEARIGSYACFQSNVENCFSDASNAVLHPGEPLADVH